MLILLVQVTMKAGRENEVLESFRKLEAETRREPGCIYYRVQQSRENPLRFAVYEQYADEAALDAHRASPHFQAYAKNGFYQFVEERKAELFNPISA